MLRRFFYSIVKLLVMDIGSMKKCSQACVVHHNVNLSGLDSCPVGPAI